MLEIKARVLERLSSMFEIINVTLRWLQFVAFSLMDQIWEDLCNI